MHSERLQSSSAAEPFATALFLQMKTISVVDVTICTAILAEVTIQ